MHFYFSYLAEEAHAYINPVGKSGAEELSQYDKRKVFCWQSFKSNQVNASNAFI